MRVRCFGHDWLADCALDQFDSLGESPRTPDIFVSRVARLASRKSPRAIYRGAIYDDGFRLSWRDEVTFDAFDGNRVEYRTGPGWRNEQPALFYGTLASLILAWRGYVSLHATALEISGRAVLLTGPTGAGKSTLAAELMQAGAQLVSDDLTVLRIGQDGSPAFALRGRPAMRLHPVTAWTLDCSRRESVLDDPRGKLLAWPLSRFSGEALPVAGLILLGESEGPLSSMQLVPLLPELLFRPVWMEALPEHASIRAQLLELALRLPARRLLRVTGFTAEGKSRRIDSALAAIAAMAP